VIKRTVKAAGVLAALVCGSACLPVAAPANAGSTISGKINCKGLSKCSAVVYAERTPRDRVPAPAQPVVMDQTNLAFTPRVLPVVVGTTVVFPNHDEVPHNVYSSSPTKIFNVGIYPRGDRRLVTFDRAGEVVLMCNIHPHMVAYVLVLDQPYFIVSSDDGRFSLKDLPPGKYTVTAWHEKYKPVSTSLEIKRTASTQINLDLQEAR
jgi:plastocyanin